MSYTGAVPDLYFTLRYGDDVAARFGDTDWCARLIARAERSLVQLLARLGVPATPALAVEAAPGATRMRLYVEDVVLPLPASDVNRLVGLHGGMGSPDDAAQLLAALVTRTAEANASLLVGDRQNLRWIEGALARHPAAEPIARYAECTRAVLRALLAQGIGIGDIDSICRYLLEGLNSRRRTAAIAESAIARLQPATLDIEINAPYAARLFPGLVHGPLAASDLPQASREIFEKVRDALFSELGVRIPPIRLVPGDELPPGAFRLRSGAVGWAPWRGLDPEHVFFAVHPDQLEARGIAATPFVYPPNDGMGAAVPTAQAAAVEQLGVYAWNPVGYIGLAVMRDVRGNAGVLLDIDAVESALAQLEPAFPELVYAALEKISATDLTRVLRKLLAGDVSIRNFRSVLERLLAYDFVSTDLTKEVLFDPRLPVDCRLDPLHEPDQVERYVEYVRSGLRTWLSHRSRDAAGRVLVRPLDGTSIERPILEELAYRQAAGLGRPLDRERLDRIREAVRAAAAVAPDATLLTLPPVASFLREELRAVVPQQRVLSYQELAWDVPRQWLERLRV